jgi:hypothetical protein
MDDSLVIEEITRKLAAAKVTVCKTPYGFGLWPKHRVPKDVLPDVWEYVIDIVHLARTTSVLPVRSWGDRPPKHICFSDILFREESNIAPGERCPRCGGVIDGFAGMFGQCEECELDSYLDDQC